MNRPQCWAVVPAAGSGSRFGGQNKLIEKLGGEPVLLKTVKALMAAEFVDGVALSVSAENIGAFQQLLEGAKLPKPFHVVEGGASRRESVLKGIESLPLEAALVAVHDAARPLIDPVLVDEAIRFLVEDSALGVLLAMPLHDTIKRVDETGMVVETLDRATLWCAQTPQVFWTEILLKAHRKVPATAEVTDDAQLLELAGLSPVKFMRGSAENLKITTPDDLRLAESILEAKKSAII